MKQFKKWFSKECDDDRTIYQSSYDDCQDAWKAALEWAIQNEFVTDEIYKELKG